MQSAKRQSGTVLIVVIMLLLLASVLTFFTLSVGVFEQQTSGNDLKAKMVSEMADAGLAQGAEYIKQNYKLAVDTSKWTLCTAADTTFPCGSVPQSRRATMYRWSGTGGTGLAMGNPTLPIAAGDMVTGTQAGNLGFVVSSGVGAVLCRVAYKVTKTAATTCTDSASASPTSIITLVSTASIPGEGARGTVIQSIGISSIIGNLPASPPVVASGSINLVGTIQVVTNPNAGGTGVPVSLWTPKSLNGNGTGNSCYANEFYNSGGSVDWSHVATLPTFPLCDDCSCNGSLSSAHGNTVSNGIDSLNGDDNTAGGGNAAVHVDKDQTKTEFPCDLFQQVFSVQAWEDDLPAGTPPGDGFCETHIMSTYTNPNDNTQVVTMGVDEVYLYTYAGYIKVDASRTYTCASGCTTIAASALLTSAQAVAKTSGLVWCQDGSLCAHGTADAPVLMVFDGSGPNLTNSGDVYGMVFGRSTGYATAGVLDATAGGDASFSMSGNGVVYGAIVLQGTTGHLNGTSAVVYNKDILTALANGGGFTKVGGVVGSWTDHTSY